MAVQLERETGEVKGQRGSIVSIPRNATGERRKDAQRITFLYYDQVGGCVPTATIHDGKWSEHCE